MTKLKQQVQEINRYQNLLDSIMNGNPVEEGLYKEINQDLDEIAQFIYDYDHHRKKYKLLWLLQQSLLTEPKNKSLLRIYALNVSNCIATLRNFYQEYMPFCFSSAVDTFFLTYKNESYTTEESIKIIDDLIRELRSKREEYFNIIKYQQARYYDDAAEYLQLLQCNNKRRLKAIENKDEHLVEDYEYCIESLRKAFYVDKGT